MEHRTVHNGYADSVQSASRTTDAGKFHPETEKSHGFFVWNVRITPSVVITFGCLQFLLLGLVFIYGFCVGKSFMPLSEPVALEDLNEANVQITTVGEDQQNNAGILEKEELNFLSTLKGEQQSGILLEKDKNAPGAEKQLSLSSKDKAVQEAPAKDRDQPKVPQFDYVIRAAAFNSKDPAQALAAKIVQQGLKTRVTNVKTPKKTWYYVQVLLRGSSDDLKLVQSKLASLGLRDAMVVNEKPVKKK